MATGLFNLKQVNQAINQGAWSGYIAPKWVEYLVVAGGGGAGGAGGAGGGLLTGIVTVAAGTSYTVTVGSGGTGGPNESTSPATSGSNSVFGSISATGGGKGGTWYSSSQNAVALGATGGSGGGSAGQYTFSSYVAGAQGTAGQGNAGGSVIGATGVPYYQAGGGGAGTVGLNAKPDGYAGNGGAGIASSISGTVITYAGGGGGGRANGATDANTGKGGVGGGGDAGTTASSSGTAGGGNTGGGGGGSNGSATGSNGGSGIVVVRYPGNVQFFTGGTLSYANGYMIHTFYASGTLAPTTPTPYVTDYQISRSLRFNSADSAYLNRTPASASNRKTWTWSGWVKFCKSGWDPLFSIRIDGNNQFFFNHNESDQIRIYDLQSAVLNFDLVTTQVFRDYSAWYHLVFAVDTTQATASNRLKLYVNGSQITAFNTASYPSQNTDLLINSTNNHLIGNFSTSYANAYMTEINFIDGQALTPSSFGYTNPATGVWSPLAFVGTYGTNGFYLNFSDNSNTTAATLGKDYSGNGNNWTPNNFSVTAGAGNDSLVDSPTSYGTDTGVGGEVRGNYATLNPLDTRSVILLTNGNLSVAQPSSGATGIAKSTFAVSSGKWYVEFTSGSSANMVGITLSTTPNTVNYLGVVNSNAIGYYSNGDKYNSFNNTSGPYGASYTTGDVVGIALDLNAGTVTFYKNGASQGVAVTGLSGEFVFAWGDNTASISGSFNFGQRPFAYTAPSGYKALCTQNLPQPTIGATSTTLATSYFNPVTYTGLGATQTVTVGFQPDFTWIKNRTLGANWHVLTDSVRGVQKEIYTNSTAAEATLTTSGVNQFNAGGFQILGNTNDYNGSTSNYVAWNWRASNATAVTNTAGSITSTVSANTTSGFSVVTYTGTGTTGTIGHGLGVAPSMIIVKCRSNATTNWYTYHISIGNTGALALNLTDATITSSSFWNNTSPTSSVFTISGASGELNGSGRTYVAYAFAEVAGYSKFGSYTGNGSSTDGPFVYCGFRPAYVMIKRTEGTSVDWVWWVMDNKRGPYNATANLLKPNSADAENPSALVDFVSNGFKVRNGSGSVNNNGINYIYAAFAESPFKYSLAR